MIPEMWLDGDHCDLVVRSPHGPLLQLPLGALLPHVQLAAASMEGGTLLSFSWQPPVDPEEPDAEPLPRQFARLIIQRAEALEPEGLQ